jgi:multisubunit Na+/H+ antiporter MnhC subunit
MNYERNRKYFQPTQPALAGILLIIGIIMLLVPNTGAKIIGIIVTLLAAYRLYFVISRRTKDKEIDDVVAQEVANARTRALSKLGVDEEQVSMVEPIIVEGFAHKGFVAPVLHTLGKDRQWRSSVYETIMLFFSEQQVYCYWYRFSIIANEKSEGTDEYFYKDIVSVATSSDNITFKDVKGRTFKVNFEEFKLTTSGGTSITCSIQNHETLEGSIQGMKQLLREKKGA